MKTLDDVFQSENIILNSNEQHRILLKIDVEGFEYNVLKGGINFLKSNLIDFIQFEAAKYQIYENQRNDNDIAVLLESLGYVLVKKFTFPTLSFADEVYELRRQ